jgi:hypothetical protein
MTERDFYRTYVDEYLDERKTIENEEYIKFIYTENKKTPNVSYINKKGDIIRESSVKMMSDDGTISDLRSSRTDSHSFRSPGRSPSRSPVRSPVRSERTDSHSFRSPGRAVSPVIRPHVRTTSIMGTLGTATTRAIGTIGSLATSVFPRIPPEERPHGARDRTPIRRR